MAFHITFFSILMAVFFITFQFSSSHARTFEVGGKDGWTLNPSENYNNWSGRLRFLINDTLHFKYDGGSDSVLVVNKDDYEGCDLNSPIAKLDGGDSTFKLDRSGPFYFVSGNKSSCDRGQKLMVVVLALRKRSPPPAAATPPSPAATPPSPATLPPSPAVSPTIPPSSSPSPTAVSPGSPAPAAGGPGSLPPADDGTPGSPTGMPGIPGLNPPGATPGGGISGSPSGATGQSPGSNNPAADVNSPPPPSAAPPLSGGGVTASFATMIFALWVIN